MVERKLYTLLHWCFLYAQKLIVINIMTDERNTEWQIALELHKLALGCRWWRAKQTTQVHFKKDENKLRLTKKKAPSSLLCILQPLRKEAGLSSERQHSRQKHQTESLETESPNMDNMKDKADSQRSLGAYKLVRKLRDWVEIWPF